MPSSRAPWDIHPKVAVAAIAGLLFTILAPVAAKAGIDLSGQEANLQALVMLAAGYLTPGN